MSTSELDLLDLAPGILIEGRLVFGAAGSDLPSLRVPIEAGQWTCLLGPSGVGKSTLLRLIAGLEAGGRLEGRMTVSDGRPLAGRIAYMAQTDLLVPWLDVLGNIALGARLRGDVVDTDRAAALARRVGLGGRERAKPTTLSGGQRQRVALGRTLMEDRPVALLDEPFSALDARTRAEMQELAWELLAGRTVLMVTHEPAEAARLGHAVWILAESGLSQGALPGSSPIRDPSDAVTLEAGAALLAQLRAGAGGAARAEAEAPT
ncbi:MAG: ATP-binding cassette domain-containing protein [Pseudomonadota bacterium]